MTVSITVLGIVQGVGFRPFTANLADKLGITGTVLNSGGFVHIMANGSKEKIDEFLHLLKENQPAGAQITRILTKRVPEHRFADFQIVESTQNTSVTPMIPADLPMCETCRQELYDSSNRRYRYPFISCVACGPRYSILHSLPYDRETITMGEFPMCKECEKEYRGSNRRRHAQTISCHDCGPQLILQTENSRLEKDKALQKAIVMLKNGAVIALKGIGGYQFACLPQNKQAVSNLRLLKHRPKKPFAVMFSNIDSIKNHCELNSQEEELLLSPARPIVLLSKKTNAFCSELSGESRFLGAFIAYTPLHQLLTDDCGPLVMTSGNISSEPIIIDDDAMLNLKSPYLDGVLYHTRQIVTQLDDSVARVVQNKSQLIRRSRGYVPLPIALQKNAQKPILAMGGDLKSCFCLYQNDCAYLSQYFGDMEQYSVLQVYQQNLNRMEQLFDIHPQAIACDLHPNYQTSQMAEQFAQQRKIQLVKVQHHHAHVASVMAEYDLHSCIGVAFDGTGFGTDGAVWGGEFLLCKNAQYERKAHLNYVTLCGGDSASKNARLTANCYSYNAKKTSDDSDFPLIQAAIANKINTQNSSSMGRLFDAISAILGIRTENSYEGECAIALENTAVAAKQNGINSYSLHFNIQLDGSTWIVNQTDLFKDMATAVENGENVSSLALGFHLAVAEMIRNVCENIRCQSDENRVALSGGVFSNLLLMNTCVELLKNSNFEVYFNSAVPTNDGGICLGQAWLLNLEIG